MRRRGSLERSAGQEVGGGGVSTDFKVAGTPNFTIFYTFILALNTNFINIIIIITKKRAFSELV